MYVALALFHISFSTSDSAPGVLAAPRPPCWSLGLLLRSLHDHACASCWCERCLAPSLCATLSIFVCAVPRPILAPSWALLIPHPEMCDNGDSEDKPPAPPVRMSSTIFSTGSGKDSLSANHSSKPLPSVPEERKPRNKIISIFSGAEKSEKTTAVTADAL